MKKCLTSAASVLALCTYVLVGIVGGTPGWKGFDESFLNRRIEPVSSSSIPLGSRPMWTEQKHTASAVRVVLSLPEVPLNGTLVVQRQIECVLPHERVTFCSQEVYFSQIARAPPHS